VPYRPSIDHNVAIGGGGQTGSTLVYGLRRVGFGKVTVLDAGAGRGTREDLANRGAHEPAARAAQSCPVRRLGTR
jgi:2-polyprenyl-6-methoxyphenol hydroxylase-like FAD-dependent oxidoreductase